MKLLLESYNVKDAAEEDRQAELAKQRQDDAVVEAAPAGAGDGLAADDGMGRWLKAHERLLKEQYLDNMAKRKDAAKGVYDLLQRAAGKGVSGVLIALSSILFLALVVYFVFLVYTAVRASPANAVRMAWLILILLGTLLAWFFVKF